ncbi:hypothetical protein CWI38_2609p0010 [Hamiltosporidium tvaerminnensis]|uniref:Uncharacterized protein n=1 Tax=Hamiltosporidium tvaerminnensis TaxID=1176355 RepID=A0A4Q9L3N2_9MICR|nr:hypothetical protein LUQ84_003348 [Hamiltosporidium tvaerminnensis]TBU02078.1 hypothetical protein CWI37_0561p0010 [Hamiltosporidium tvaerminnensis]TBU06258.1 hypothetical protein CWI38_2609p0010 [Hamiltosporidium tvaerminnensis]
MTENTQQRRRVPGIKEHLDAISRINSEINSIVETVKDYESKVSTEIALQRENSPRTQLYQKKDQLETDHKATLSIRNTLISKKQEILPTYTSLKNEMHSEKKKLHIDNFSQLEKQESDLKSHLLKKKVTAQEEKMIASQLSEISRKKRSFGTIKTKEEELSKYEEKLEKLNKELNEIQTQIKTEKEQILSIKTELEKLKTQGKTKSNSIIDYENKIEDLNKKKKDLMSKRKEQNEEIRKKQEIYEKHLQEIKKQTEIEESKKHIKIRIKEYEIQRNNLIEEKYKLDSDNFNSIIEAVKKIPISHQTFTMPISLISLLNQVQVNLPKNYQDIDRCIEELFKKKEEFEKKIEPNMLRLNKQIQEIDEKIKEEYKVLEGMPPTEVKVYKEKKIVG